jgi:hypothetical protein
MCKRSYPLAALIYMAMTVSSRLANQKNGFSPDKAPVIVVAISERFTNRSFLATSSDLLILTRCNINRSQHSEPPGLPSPNMFIIAGSGKIN